MQFAEYMACAFFCSQQRRMGAFREISYILSRLSFFFKYKILQEKDVSSYPFRRNSLIFLSMNLLAAVVHTTGIRGFQHKMLKAMLVLTMPE